MRLEIIKRSGQVIAAPALKSSSGKGLLFVKDKNFDIITYLDID